MPDDLKLLADYCYNTNSKVKIQKIWEKQVKELFEKDNVKLIYEIYKTNNPGAWYYIITKNNMRFIVQHKFNNVNTKMMMSSFIYNKQYTQVETRLLDILYNYDNLPVKNKSNGSTVKILSINGKYALTEETIGEYKFYNTVIYGVPLYDVHLTNMITAVNIFYNEFPQED